MRNLGLTSGSNPTLQQQLLDGGQMQTRLLLSTFYGSEMTLADLDVTSWSFDYERGRDMPVTGSVTVLYSSTDGKSESPADFTDKLAPFGQQATVNVEVSAGTFKEIIPLGRFKILSTPEARDTDMRFGSRVITTSSEVKLELIDLLEGVRASGFTTPTRPAYTHCWAELARISKMQVYRSVPDVSIPPSIEYEIEQGGRLKACQQIAARLGGTLYVRPDGSLTVIPDTPASATPVKTYTLGEDGLQLSEIRRQLSSEGIYNEVVGKFEDGDGNPISLPPARITDGPLSVNGPLGPRTRYYSSTYVRTLSQARTTLASILAQSSTRKPVLVPIELPFDPRLEIGDIIGLQQSKETLAGSVEKIGLSDSGVMKLDVSVTGRVPEINFKNTLL